MSRQAAFAGHFRPTDADDVTVLGFWLWAQYNCFLGALGLPWSLPSDGFMGGAWKAWKHPMEGPGIGSTHKAMLRAA